MFIRHSKKDYFSQMKQNREIDPPQAMREVWNDTDLEYVLNELRYWFYMALSHENCAYEEANDRKVFIEFYDKFLTLIEATSITNDVSTLPTIKAFYTLYPIDYVRSELWNFLKAVGIYEGPFTKDIDKVNIFSFYSNLLCIAEAAYTISQRVTVSN